MIPFFKKANKIKKFSLVNFPRFVYTALYDAERVEFKKGVVVMKNGKWINGSAGALDLENFTVNNIKIGNFLFKASGTLFVSGLALGEEKSSFSATNSSFYNTSVVFPVLDIGNSTIKKSFIGERFSPKNIVYSVLIDGDKAGNISESEISNSTVNHIGLVNCSIENSYIKNCQVTSTKITNCTLSYCTISHSQLYNCEFINSKCIYNNISDSTGKNNDVRGCKLANNTISKSTFMSCECKDCRFVGVELFSSDLVNNTTIKSKITISNWQSGLFVSGTWHNSHWQNGSWIIGDVVIDVAVNRQNNVIKYGPIMSKCNPKVLEDSFVDEAEKGIKLISLKDRFFLNIEEHNEKILNHIKDTINNCGSKKLTNRSD